MKYSFSGTKGNFQGFFSSENLTNRETLKTGENSSIAATVYLGGIKYLNVLTLTYKAKAGNTGKASKAKL